MAFPAASVVFPGASETGRLHLCVDTREKESKKEKKTEKLLFRSSESEADNIFPADRETDRGFPSPSPRCMSVSARQLSSVDVFKLLK